MLGNTPRRVKHADGGDAGGTGSHDAGNPLDRDAANAEHGNRRGRGNRRQPGEAGWFVPRLRAGREYRSEDEVIEGTPLRRGDGILNRVDGTSDEKSRRRGSAYARSGERIAAKMDAVRVRSKRDVEPVVDHDARPRSTHRVDARGYETCQRGAVEIALADLHEVDTRARRRTHAIDERDFPRRSITMAIGDQTENGRQPRKP